MQKLFESWRSYLDEDVSNEQFEEFKTYAESLEEADMTKRSYLLQDYAESNFSSEDRIAGGHQKTVYQFDDQTVLKAGELKYEIRAYEVAPEIMPEILEMDPKFCWALTEKVDIIHDGEEEIFNEFFPQTVAIVDKYFEEYDQKWIMYRIASFMLALTSNFSKHILEGILKDSDVPEVIENAEESLLRLKTDLMNTDVLFRRWVNAATDMGYTLDDIRPGNVGITESGELVIVDF
jgi:hypothetical protein